MNGVNECYACNCKLSYLQCVKLLKCKSFTSQIVLHVDNNKKIVEACKCKYYIPLMTMHIYNPH